MVRGVLSVLLFLGAVLSAFATPKQYTPKGGKRVPQTLSRGLWLTWNQPVITRSGDSLCDTPLCVFLCVCVCRLGRPADLGSDVWRGSVLGQVKVSDSPGVTEPPQLYMDLMLECVFFYYFRNKPLMVLFHLEDCPHSQCESEPPPITSE